MSIDARMKWALWSAVTLTALLVAATFHTTSEIGRINTAVRGATSDLRSENAREVALRRLRTTVGEATRGAERGRTVDTAEWLAIDRMVSELVGPRVVASSRTRPRPMALMLARADDEAVALGASARALLETARTSPGEIKSRLPAYLRDLAALEEARTDVRHDLANHADAGTQRNLMLIRGWQATLVGGVLGLVLLFAALTRWVRRGVVEPMRRIRALLLDPSVDCAGEQPDARSPDGRNPDGRNPGARDWGRRSRNGNEMGALAHGVAVLQSLLAERGDALGRLQHTARRDALTGLFNRTTFDEQLPDALDAAAAADGEVALICIDVDQFKEINDSIGHVGGDGVLCQVADVLQLACSAGENGGANETVCRIGGDEFAIIQTGFAQPGAAKSLAKRLLAAFHEHRSEASVSVGISIGVAISPRDGDDGAQMRHHADLALYRAKNEGRGQACFFGELDVVSRSRFGTGHASLAIDLPAAIRCGELCVHYQPKMQARTGVIDGVEALVRWNHPARGRILPDEFVPIAEKTGQIRALTEWVLRRTIIDQAWLADRGRDLGIFVNISAPLLGDPDFADTLLGLVDSRRGTIGLEITETAIIDDPRSTLANLHRFVDAGLRIAIDDYGAGWSSLSYLKRLPAHELKIDRTFVSDISRSHRDPLLVRSTIDLAHALGMKVTAEGVETAAALALLKVMGCDLVQGFLISHPLPLDELMLFLADADRLLHLETRSVGFEAAAQAFPT